MRRVDLWRIAGMLAGLAVAHVLDRLADEVDATSAAAQDAIDALQDDIDELNEALEVLEVELIEARARLPENVELFSTVEQSADTLQPDLHIFSQVPPVAAAPRRSPCHICREAKAAGHLVDSCKCDKALQTKMLSGRLGRSEAAGELP